MSKEKESKVSIWFRENFTTKTISLNAYIAAIYVVLTMLSYPLSYGLIQFRISELLNLLVFFNPIYTIGMTIGCLIVNIMSWSPWDILFGTLATLIGCLMMILVKKVTKSLFLSSLCPVIANGLIIGSELFILNIANTALYVAMGYVALGEFVVISIIGYIFFMLLAKKYKGFYKLINAKNDFELRW